ncbi:Aspartyl protease family protein [Melia azedarach]|uniref:Aspartyl protease family protein n=1 Tax=Melia azedarach TaxID=155640 RepID=A0ACC1Y7X1_MELAZ|nr:Aspartyl protease family protein [Melia azedarach]
MINQKYFNLFGISGSENGATILELKHKNYCSGKHIDWNKDQQKRLILDDLHVQNLQSRIKNKISGNIKDVSSTENLPLASGIRLQTLNYVVTVELGGEKMTVIVDTGSDLTWIQCQPCKSCYSQQDPIFNPSTSPSYQKVLCNSSSCHSLEFATGNSGVCASNPPACNYFVSYGDGSYTRGELAREHLNLGKTSVKDFVFGCGRNNKGLFGGTSGLMGLGRSVLSLVSQTSSIFGGVFSYCLPSTQAGASGSLILGGNSSVYRNSTPVTFTRMISNPQLPTFYFLNLTGITIGGKQLRDSGFGKGGILIDSGTVITRLPPSIYRALKAEFVKQFSGFPSAPGFSILDTCYNLSAYQEVNIPLMKLQFEGNAELNVDVIGIFYFVKSDASQVCLALASLTFDDEIGIIGNYQQRNQRVIYDTKKSQLGIAGESCSSM